MKTVNLTDEEHQELLVKRAAKEAAKASEAKRQDMVRAEAVTAGAPVGNKNAAGHHETTEGKHLLVQHGAGGTYLHVFNDEDHAGMFHGQLKASGSPGDRIGRAKGSKAMTIGTVAERTEKQFGKYPEIVRHDQSSPATEEIKASEPATVTAAGTSEGARKGWEARSHSGIGVVHDLSHENGHGFVMPAMGSAKSKGAYHSYAQRSDGETYNHHHDTAEAAKTAVETWLSHKGPAVSQRVKSSEVIHCRDYSASSTKLGSSEAWEVGKPVKFTWMPAGVHTILAGFRNGSIELTVNCTPDTVSRVQASLDEWRLERPKQEPFGCIEHREQEASVRVTASCGFEWGADGITISAEPTSLGTNNVNGRIHRSWSPSFETDAEYSRATEVNGVLKFPEGVRGSRSNPAQITGVDFCVGTLTNKPAFHAMPPVKSSEAGGETVQAEGTSEGARKGWQHRTDAAHKMTAAVDHLERSLGNTKDEGELKSLAMAHDKAAEAHNSAAYHAENAEGISGVQSEIVAHRHQQLSAHHKFAARRIRELRERTAKASEAKPELTPDTILAEYTGDTVTAAWSDAARQAALEARKNKATAGGLTAEEHEMLGNKHLSKSEALEGKGGERKHGMLGAESDKFYRSGTHGIVGQRHLNAAHHLRNGDHAKAEEEASLAQHHAGYLPVSHKYAFNYKQKLEASEPKTADSILAEYNPQPSAADAVLEGVIRAGAPFGNKNAAGSHNSWFMKGHQEAYDFHKPKADYYASKSGIGDSDDLAKFHGERAEFHKKELEKYEKAQQPRELDERASKLMYQDEISSGRPLSSPSQVAEYERRHPKTNASATDAAIDEIVRAAGTSEGAKRGWEHRAEHAMSLSKEADKKSKAAGGTHQSHYAAADAHQAAWQAHWDAADELKEAGLDNRAQGHISMANRHSDKQTRHLHQGNTLRSEASASHHSPDADERAQALENMYPNKATEKQTKTATQILGSEKTADQILYARAGA